MARISSTRSNSSSLGNTALSGFGGLASGIDRDALIEQLTSATQKKITKAQQETTRLNWKQDAIRNIADKLIDLQDEYLSFTGSSSIKDSTLFAANVVTPEGSADATKFIKASGASDMTKHIHVQAVSRTASSASVVSGVKGTISPITTGIDAESLTKSDAAVLSNLRGKTLEFGQYNFTENKFHVRSSFTFPSSYTDGEGKTHTLDYTSSTPEAKQKLVEDLNAYLKNEPVALDGANAKLSFAYDKDKDAIRIEGGSDNGYSLKPRQPVLKALGYEGSGSEDYLRISDFNAGARTAAENGSGFSESSVTKKSMLDLLSGSDFRISYKGVSKDVKMLTQEERNSADMSGTDGETLLRKLAEKFQAHVDEAFGRGKIKVSVGESGKLELTNAEAGDKSALSLSASDAGLRANIGISENASNKLTLNSSLWDNREKLFGSEAAKWSSEEELTAALADFKINGTAVQGITAKTSVNEMLKKINESKAGVRASYMEGSGRFVLISEESGSGREIKLGDAEKQDSVEQLLFGGSGSIRKDGQDAEMIYDYGNGVSETVTSSSNTFRIDGLRITVSGSFGIQTDSEGNLLHNTDGSYKLDSSKTVSFSSKADADKATETVKKFVKAYNEIVDAVNEQVRTRPSSGYDPLTDAQREEMSDKSIENWEKKAKEGLLYNESSVRNLSNDLQTVMTSMVRGLEKMGLSYKDMEKIGLTMSSDYHDGGRLEFDEAKFKRAMENEPETVSKIMTGSNGVKGLAKTIEDVGTKYATRYSVRNGGSYGELVTAGGSNRISMSKQKNSIYTALKANEEQIQRLKEMLKTEQKRYISQFTAMETAISNMNAQSSYLSSLTG